MRASSLRLSFIQTNHHNVPSNPPHAHSPPLIPSSNRTSFHPPRNNFHPDTNPRVDVFSFGNITRSRSTGNKHQGSVEAEFEAGGTTCGWTAGGRWFADLDFRKARTSPPSSS